MRKPHWQWLPILAAVVLLISTPLLSRFPAIIESLYAHGFYQIVTRVTSPVSTLVPFSLSEILLYAMIGGGIYWIARGLWRRRLWKAVRELAVAGSVVVLWFYVAWGFNYFRQPLDRSLGFTGVPADSAAIREHFAWAVAKANTGWRTIPEWSIPELDHELETSYRRVFASLHMTLPPGRRWPKTATVPAVLDYTLTSGIFGPLFHEIHLNAHLLPVELPFVLAHEKAHQLGYAREDEANFLAVLVCLTSADPAVRYSGQFAVLGRSMWRGYHSFAGDDSIRQQVRPEVIADFAAVSERVRPYFGPVAELAERAYDVYLKANRVEGGVRSYGDVVDLLIRWRKKNVGALLPG